MKFLFDNKYAGSIDAILGKLRIIVLFGLLFNVLNVMSGSICESCRIGKRYEFHKFRKCRANLKCQHGNYASGHCQKNVRVDLEKCNYSRCTYEKILKTAACTDSHKVPKCKYWCPEDED
ncbi:hypothetical protein BY996DRAFT_8693512 [Phakopsora pachyrhizi]|nr:hypothetical protein BY996DRAFT_8693512 [Phakopsora pachyrhizi]